VLLADGELRTAKAPTAASQEESVVAAVEAVLAGRPPADVERFTHGTTIVTNALLERRGARTALVATAGLEHVLRTRPRGRAMCSRSRRPAAAGTDGRSRGHSSLVPYAPKPRFLERRMTRFIQSPVSVRVAASVIVTATASVVVLGGILMRVIDHEEYANIWVGMWWAMQTVTTVGYGDVTPAARSGRIVATVVMLQGIAFLSITTAVITSTFIARAQRERLEHQEAEDEAEQAGVEARLAELAQRLDRIETALAKLTAT